MLSDHPIKFNQTEIYFPSTFTVKREVVEVVNQSEAGTDIVQVARQNKVSVSVSTNCTSDWVSIFEEFSEEPYFTLSFWNDNDEAYETHTVRMRGFQKSLIKKSWAVALYNGIWGVSFTLEEF